MHISRKEVPTHYAISIIYSYCLIEKASRLVALLVARDGDGTVLWPQLGETITRRAAS
jgi:hypothetical protein